MKHVVMFSGGVGSWAAARRVADMYGTADLTLLFTDTLIEDEDNYRFIQEAAANVGVPLTRIAEGRDVWQVFHDERYLGNHLADPCSKILKRQLADKYIAAHYDPADTIRYVGIDWTERHRYTRLAERMLPWRMEAPMCDKPYMTKPQVIEWARSQGLEPPRMYGMGFSHANCFTGETRFITSKGTQSLADMVGQEVEVLGRGGGWQPATVQAFGQQEIWKLTLKRYTHEKVIYTTINHRWFRRHSRTGRDEVLTHQLRPGDKLASMWGRLNASVRPSAYGIAHGIVFGDGSRSSESYWRNPANVVLCGDKDAQLLKWFPLSPTKEVPGIGIRVNDLPRQWKDRPPLSESQSYLYGWLSGYFAADGTVVGGEIKLSSAKRDNLEFVRDVAVRLGLATNPIQEHRRMGLGKELTSLYTLSFVPDTLRPDFFLIAEHKARYEGAARHKPADWQVVSLEPTGRVEDVFCAVVPDGHVFTLEDNVLTGNCGGFCVKAGQGHFALLLRQLPEVYAHHEAKEQELREYLDKDVAIMRDRTGGTSRPLTMREFRERIQADTLQADMFDVGGCGCFSDVEVTA